VPQFDVLPGVNAGWLRDNCPCPACRDQVSGQRLVGICDQPADATLTNAVETTAGILVTFGPDGHQAVISRSWLAEQSCPALDSRCEDAKDLWSASNFPGGPLATDWQSYRTNGSVRLHCLLRLVRSGFLLLREVPPEPGMVLDVAGSMGFVRETNYGRLFDVRVEATPANLAFTGLPIAPHTDNPYRDPVPTVQLLHCLANAADGGDSGVLDGFRAAAVLRAEAPAAFRCLTTTPVTFCYADAVAELRATKPMIGVDPGGRIREVRYNSRSMQPLRKQATPDEAADEMRDFYAAYRAFAAILIRPGLGLAFRLAPGDCLVFDNTRIMHSRTGFAAAGRRHLQGCYADLDGVESQVAVLGRTQR
jgi:gamma-butyrobetaine dioxygenase